MVEAYWHIGQVIVEDEQQGRRRAGYGDKLVRGLALRLSAEFGSGFDASNLKRMRQFYLAFPKGATTWHQSGPGRKGATPWHLLSWSHFKLLVRVDKPKARIYYAEEAAAGNWSVRVLERQIHSLYYERILASGDQGLVKQEALDHASQSPARSEDVVKDPYVLEFLGLPGSGPWLERAIEQALIDKLRDFMLELGRGFAFVARQKRISTETKDFFIDLVFYNYSLKCFVLIDLKAGELTHQDIGQMDMYVRLFEDTVKGPDDNPTIGIILCTEKDETIVRYSVLKGNRRLFASRYRLFLPSEQELVEEIARERSMLLRERAER